MTKEEAIKMLISKMDGNIVNITDNNLITGSTKSCGCLKEINRWKKN